MDAHAGPSRSRSVSQSSRTAPASQSRPHSQSQSKKRARERESESASRDLEDSPPPPPELDDLLLVLRSEVVGIQHYKGLVGPGECVLLRREPHNPYDRNAIQILNAGGTQVGHIPRVIAARLAELLDGGVIAVEGRMVSGNIDGATRYKLSIDLPVYARPAHRAVLETELKWATPESRGFEYMRTHALNVYGDPRLAEIGLLVSGSTARTADTHLQHLQHLDRGKKKKDAGKGTDTGSAGAAVERISESKPDSAIQRVLDGLARVHEDDEAADGVMSALTADLDVSSLPEHASPPSRSSGELTTDLLPHQSQALEWMLAHERPSLPGEDGDAVQLWVRKRGATGTYFLNVATRTPQSSPPALGRGGIIADGMGLGKTLTTLALVLASRGDKVGKGVSKATLVVCPLSVLSNWEKQIRDHVVPGKLVAYTYHGANRDVTPTTLAQYDVVLTTYETVAGDMTSKKSKTSSGSSSSKGPLAQVKWKRVVADEGHVLKNPKANMTLAFAALVAERRWVATGTPIVNTPADLGSLLTCIRMCAPLDQVDYFRSTVLRPLRAGKADAGRLLQAIVGQTLLRRTKDTKTAEGDKIVALPPIEHYQVPVVLDPATRVLYEAVMEESARRFRETMSTGQADITILSMITRMRQLCLSADLVPADFLEQIKAGGESSASSGGYAPAVALLSKEQRTALERKLQRAIADQEECPACFNILKDPCMTSCGDAICRGCVSDWCPVDGHGLGPTSLLESLPEDTSSDTEDDDETAQVPSAKIAELVRYLRMFDAGDKTLVFSQFTSFLDRVQRVLKSEGIRFCRFDGNMDAKKRREVIASFQTPVFVDKRTPAVMLISLKSGAVGLNLTAASNVFLCDPWWQSAIEAQAIDRVHRMGQRKTVRVFQLIAEDTIESRVLDIQKRKDELVATAFARTGTAAKKVDKKQARFEELKQLFGV